MMQHLKRPAPPNPLPIKPEKMLCYGLWWKEALEVNTDCYERETIPESVFQGLSDHFEISLEHATFFGTLPNLKNPA
jgi:hypothetical protein